MPETATTSDPHGAARLFDQGRKLDVGTVADIAELEGLSIEAVYQAAWNGRPINGIHYWLRKPVKEVQLVDLPKAGVMPDGTHAGQKLKRQDLEPGGVAEFDVAGRVVRTWKTRAAAATEIGISQGMLQSLMALQASHKGCTYHNSLTPPDQRTMHVAPAEEDPPARRPIPTRPIPALSRTRSKVCLKQSVIAASTSPSLVVVEASAVNVGGSGATPAEKAVDGPKIETPLSTAPKPVLTSCSESSAAVPSSTSEASASVAPANLPAAAGESGSTAPVGAGVEEPFKESVVAERQGRPIRAVELLLTDGTVDRRFESAKLAAAYMGCSSSGITLAIRSGNPCKGRKFRWAGSAEQPLKPSAALVAAAVVQDLGGRNLISAAIDELKKRVVKMQEAIALLEQVGG